MTSVTGSARLARFVALAAAVVALCGFTFPYPGTYFQPASALTLQKATNVGTTGGNVTITGTGFDAASVQFIAAAGPGPWLMCGVGSTCTVLSSTSTQVVVNVPALTAGNYDTLLCNRDGACIFSSQLLTVTATSTPSTILTTRLVQWFRPTDDTNTGNGTNVTAIVDKSGSGNQPTTLTNVVHTNVDTDGNNQPSWTWNGTNSSLITSNFQFGAGHTLWCMAAVKLVAAGTNPPLFALQSGGAQLQWSVSTGKPAMGGLAVWGSSTLSTPVSIYGYSVGTGSATENYGIAVNGQPAVTATGGTATQPSSGIPFAWGSGVTSGSAVSPFANMKVFESFCANAQPTSGEISSLAGYLNLRYQLAPAPTFTAATNVANTSAGAQSWRVTGANFVSGMTAVLSHANVSPGTVTTTFISSTLAEMSLPAATYTAQLYDIDLLNPDLGESTQLNAVNVTSTLDPMQIGGAPCVSWWSGDNVTPSSGNVGTWKDGSLRGNDIASNTATVYTATDATFSSHGSGTYDGATSFGTLASLAGVSAADPMFAWMVFKYIAQAGNAVALDYGGAGTEFRFDQGTAGKPRLLISSGVQWGSALGTTGVHFCYAYETGGTTMTLGVNCDSGSTGTEVTTSLTTTAIGAAQTFLVGKRSGGNFSNFKLAAFGVCKSNMTSTQISNWHTYAQTLGAP